MRKLRNKVIRPADTVLSAQMPRCSQIPSQGRQDKNKTSSISGSCQGETSPNEQEEQEICPPQCSVTSVKSPPFPFLHFKKREQNLHDRYFFFYKDHPQPGVGLRPTFLSGAGPVLYPGVSRAPGSFLGNSHHADLHYEAGPDASCCSPGTG